MCGIGTTFAASQIWQVFEQGMHMPGTTPEDVLLGLVVRPKTLLSFVQRFAPWLLVSCLWCLPGTCHHVSTPLLPVRRKWEEADAALKSGNLWGAAILGVNSCLLWVASCAVACCLAAWCVDIGGPGLGYDIGGPGPQGKSPTESFLARCRLWKENNVKFVVLDEVGMLGAAELANIDQMAARLVGNNTDVLFGGLHVFRYGCFA